MSVRIFPRRNDVLGCYDSIMSKHTQQAIEEMDAKASSGRHAPNLEDEAENRGKHVTGKMKALQEEDPEEPPTSIKGKHADEKGTFSANAERYARRLRETRRRKRSIIISTTIAVVGTLVGLGLLAVSSLMGIQSNDAQMTGDEATFVGGLGGHPRPSTDGEIDFSDDAHDNALTDEFLANEELARRQAPLESGAPKGSVEAGLDQFGGFTVTAEGIESLSGQEDPYAFALDAEDFATPELSANNAKEISKAIEASSEGESQVSCILIDLETGRGIAANLDAQTYGASSFKGPFCAYLCERADDGDLDIDGVRSSMESVLVYSDNDAYDSLRIQFGDSGLAAWLESCGITDDEQLYRDWYPFQSARESALIWMHIDGYLDTDTENAKWLRDQFEGTSVSFIRDAIDSEDVTVRNKGGWYAASWEDMSEWNGTCDAGTIECNGHTYLMSVMTGQPVTEASMDNVKNLIAALWDAREDLVAADEGRPTAS